MEVHSVLRCINWFEWNYGTCITSSLFWSSSDPLAVTAKFREPGTDEVVREWVLSFDLIADVINKNADTAGIGDVQVSRLCSSTGDLFTMKLSSPGGEIKLRADLRQVHDFVTAVENYAPESHINIDAAIDKIMAGEWDL